MHGDGGAPSLLVLRTCLVRDHRMMKPLPVALVKLSELSFALPLGYGVDTDGTPSSKTKVTGPRNMDIDKTATENKIGT